MTKFEDRAADWLSIAEALERILARATPLPTEHVPLDAAMGRALAQDILARYELPPWDNSGMDGYAVRAQDVRGATPESSVQLRVTGAVAAGGASSPDVNQGEAVRIMTGAPVPKGADSVVRVEDTDREAGEEDVVRIFGDRDAGRNIRPRGQDMERGAIVVPRGRAVGPGQVAAITAAGTVDVEVYRRPSIALLPNGDELVELTEIEALEQRRAIPESNSIGLAAAITHAGGTAVRLEIARDTPTSLREGIARAEHCEALVTLGGASMGEGDLVKRVLHEMDFELDFWRVRVRPGSPISFGHLPLPDGRRLPVFGLPGNPASAFVTFQIFVRPFLLRLAGHERIHRMTVAALAGEDLTSTSGLTHFLRVVFRAGEKFGQPPRVHLAGLQNSGLVQGLGEAEGLAVVPEGIETIPQGQPVDVILLADTPGTASTPWCL